MDALEFIRERNRMCKSFGDGEGCIKRVTVVWLSFGRKK